MQLYFGGRAETEALNIGGKERGMKGDLQIFGLNNWAIIITMRWDKLGEEQLGVELRALWGHFQSQLEHMCKPCSQTTQVLILFQTAE